MSRWALSLKSAVRDEIKKGDRVVVPFVIACGHCFFCSKTLFSCCDTTNPNAEVAEKLMGHSPAGTFWLFPSAWRLCGWPGRISAGAACRCRPDQDRVGSARREGALSFGHFPDRLYGCGKCGNRAGRYVAVWGCGPVAQMAIQSCWMLGAGRVIAIDRVPERLPWPAERGRAETINFDEEDVYERSRR